MCTSIYVILLHLLDDYSRAYRRENTLFLNVFDEKDSGLCA